jgi:excisionase family DNA binding protein
MIQPLEELPEILRPPEVAEILTISVRTLYRLVEGERIGYFQVSEHGLRFRKHHVLDYLRVHTHEVSA